MRYISILTNISPNTKRIREEVKILTTKLSQKIIVRQRTQKKI